MDARGQQRSSIPQPGTLFAGKYRLQRPIARGGMGLVYLALQEPLGRRVAVKVLQEVGTDRSFRERFMSEASICAHLSHPNIVTIHDYGQTDQGALFMVMEFVEGETLDRVLGREVRLEPDRAIGLIEQVGAALAHAHRAGIVHRDLKPSNIVLTRSAEGDGLKVLDFGIAKAFSGEQAVHEDLTEAGKLIGTPRFMAPEQIRKSRIDQRTDLYALGVLAYLVTAGRPPFDGANDVALMNAHLEDDVPSLPKGLEREEPELDFLLRWLMQKRPDARPQTADELLAQLQAAARMRSFGRETVLRSSSRVAQSSGALQTLIDAPSGPSTSTVQEASPVGASRRRLPYALAILLLPLLVLGVLWLRGSGAPGARGTETTTPRMEEAKPLEPGPEAKAIPTEAPPPPIQKTNKEMTPVPPPPDGSPKSKGSSVDPAERRKAPPRRAPVRANPRPSPSPPDPAPERVEALTESPARETPKERVPVLLDEVEPTRVPVVD